MSTPQGPHSVLPLLPPEVATARAEDPSFAEVMARARARARHQVYAPERHYPYRGRRIDLKPEESDEPLPESMEALLAQWTERGARPNRYLQVVR